MTLPGKLSNCCVSVWLSASPLSSGELDALTRSTSSSQGTDFYTKTKCVTPHVSPQCLAMDPITGGIADQPHLPVDEHQPIEMYHHLIQQHNS